MSIITDFIITQVDYERTGSYISSVTLRIFNLARDIHTVCVGVKIPSEKLKVASIRHESFIKIGPPLLAYREGGERNRYFHPRADFLNLKFKLCDFGHARTAPKALSSPHQRFEEPCQSNRHFFG